MGKGDYYVRVLNVDTDEVLVSVSGTGDFPIAGTSINITETTLTVSANTESGVDSNTKTLEGSKVIACGTTTSVSDVPSQTYDSNIAYVKLGGTMSDTKPVYKFIDNAWVKQDAFQFTNGSWVKISTAPSTPSGYSISCSQFETEAGYEYQYSTDNGSTWNNITGTGLIVSATQIKFRIHNMSPSGTPSVTKKQIKSTLLGLNISMTTESTDIESENFTLTEDINDIQCFSALGYDVTITVQTEVGMETGVAVKFNTAPTDSTDYDYHTDFGGGDNSDLYNRQDELVATPKIVSDVRKMYIMAYNANENLRIILNGESMSLTNNEIHEYDITQNTTLVLIKLWD